jgi:hypothetical protein
MSKPGGNNTIKQVSFKDNSSNPKVITRKDVHIIAQ